MLGERLSFSVSNYMHFHFAATRSQKSTTERIRGLESCILKGPPCFVYYICHRRTWWCRMVLALAQRLESTKAWCCARFKYGNRERGNREVEKLQHVDSPEYCGLYFLNCEVTSGISVWTLSDTNVRIGEQTNYIPLIISKIHNENWALRVMSCLVKWLADCRNYSWSSDPGS